MYDHNEQVHQQQNRGDEIYSNIIIKDRCYNLNVMQLHELDYILMNHFGYTTDLLRNIKTPQQAKQEILKACMIANEISQRQFRYQQHLRSVSSISQPNSQLQLQYSPHQQPINHMINRQSSQPSQPSLVNNMVIYTHNNPISNKCKCQQ